MYEPRKTYRPQNPSDELQFYRAWAMSVAPVVKVLAEDTVLCDMCWLADADGLLSSLCEARHMYQGLSKHVDFGKLGHCVVIPGDQATYEPVKKEDVPYYKYLRITKQNEEYRFKRCLKMFLYIFLFLAVYTFLVIFL